MKDILRTFLTLSIAGTLLFTTAQAHAQDPGGGGSNRPARNTHQAYRSEAPLQIDAVLDEQAWQDAERSVSIVWGQLPFRFSVVSTN